MLSNWLAFDDLINGHSLIDCPTQLSIKPLFCLSQNEHGNHVTNMNQSINFAAINIVECPLFGTW